jgi:hypothetical protein
MRSLVPSTGKVFFCLCALLAATGARTSAQTPAAPAATPATPAPAAGQSAPAAASAPAKSAPSDERWETSDGQFSIALTGWYNPGTPFMQTGKAQPQNYYPAELDFGGKNKVTPGAIVSVGLGKDHTLRFSYFRTTGSGNRTAPKALTLYGTTYDQGDKLTTDYKLQNGKISLDYLSWPYPSKNARFRVKTLWEVQYTEISSEIHAPVKEAADLSLNPAHGSNFIIYPTLGMGLEYLISKHFRWEARGSGFAFPHRAYIWDAETTFNYRSGSFEFFFGGKGYGFKTSPKREEYIRDRLVGAFAGLRWYP